MVRNIFGLNIFLANDIACSIENEPQLEFLRSICSDNDVSVNIGNLFDYVDSANELFANSAYANKFSMVQVGCYGSEFYDGRMWTPLDPILLTDVSDDFIDIELRGDNLIRRILQLDAMAMFVTATEERSGQALLDLLNTQFISTEDIIERATSIYRFVLLSQADGDYFTVFAKNGADFALLDKALETSSKMIQNSTWFQDNINDFQWDGERSMCLIKR